VFPHVNPVRTPADDAYGTRVASCVEVKIGATCRSAAALPRCLAAALPRGRRQLTRNEVRRFGGSRQVTDWAVRHAAVLCVQTL
jgi:hypothetical protein